MKAPSGYVIYRGPSLLDSQPIVVIAITKSSNRKTGNMVQTYILVDNGQMPVENYKSLADSSICGDCKHRRGTGGGCYVNVGQGPTQVFKSYLRGIYPESLSIASNVCEGRNVRLGTYGDPAAVPAHIWAALLGKAAGHTGYTHQWASGKANHVKEWCMASSDSLEERLSAVTEGWRTFRVRTPQEKLGAGEFVCPASDEGGKRVHCESCLACNGGLNSRKGSPAIVAHGTLKGRFFAMQLIAS